MTHVEAKGRHAGILRTSTTQCRRMVVAFQSCASLLFCFRLAARGGPFCTRVCSFFLSVGGRIIRFSGMLTTDTMGRTLCVASGHLRQETFAHGPGFRNKYCLVREIRLCVVPLNVLEPHERTMTVRCLLPAIYLTSVYVVVHGSGWDLPLFYCRSYSFRRLVSKRVHSGYSKSLCVCPPALRKLRTYDVDFSNDA